MLYLYKNKYIMKKTIRLTESDLYRLIRRVIKETELEKIGNVTPVMNTMESRKRRINVK